MILGRDVSTVSGRAALLRELAEAAHTEGTDNGGAVGLFRDTLMRFARGAATEAELAKAAESLNGLLGAAVPMPSTMSIEPKEVVVGSPKVEAPVVAAEAPVAVPEPAPQVVPTTSVTISFGRRKAGPDIASAAPEPVVAEIQPAPIVEEVAPSAQPIAGPAPVAEPTLPQPVVAPTSPANLAEEVESINDELIAMGHGKAFQWLSNPESGYREYMNMLLALRNAFSKGVTHENMGSVTADIEKLREMAKAVATKVGNGAIATAAPEPMIAVPSPEAEPVPIAASAPSSAVVHDVASAPMVSAPPPAAPVSEIKPAVPPPPPPPLDELLTPTVPVTSIEELPAPEVPLRERQLENKGAAIADAIAGVSIDEPHTTRDEIIADVVAPTPEEVPEAPVSMPAPEPLPAAPTAPLPEAPAAVAVPMPVDQQDPLYTKAVDAKLNDLLTSWLGSTGFLGFGESGMKHPEWVAIRGLSVEDVIAREGVTPPGLKPGTYENLRENVRNWKGQYDLPYVAQETIEHFVRRIILASGQ